MMAAFAGLNLPQNANLGKMKRDEDIPPPVISTKLSSRFASRGNEEYAAKLLSAVRCEIRGHKEKPSDKPEAA